MKYSYLFERRDKEFAMCKSHVETIFQKQNPMLGCSCTCHIIIPKNFSLNAIFGPSLDECKIKALKEQEKEIEITIYSDNIHIDLYVLRTPHDRLRQYGSFPIFEHKFINNKFAKNKLSELLLKVFNYEKRLNIEYGEFNQISILDNYFCCF